MVLIPKSIDVNISTGSKLLGHKIMKILHLLVVLIFVSGLLTAQENGDVFDSRDIFGGPAIKYSYSDYIGAYSGGNIGWLVNDTYSVGFSGYGLISGITLRDDDKYLNFDYGGLELGWLIASDMTIHFYFNGLIGFGSASLHKKYRRDCYRSNLLYVLEPSANLILNVTEYFRVGLGTSYRYVSGLDLDGIGDDYFNNVSTILSFQFGRL